MFETVSVVLKLPDPAAALPLIAGHIPLSWPTTLSTLPNAAAASTIIVPALTTALVTPRDSSALRSFSGNVSFNLTASSAIFGLRTSIILCSTEFKASKSRFSAISKNKFLLSSASNSGGVCPMETLTFAPSSNPLNFVWSGDGMRANHIVTFGASPMVAAARTGPAYEPTGNIPKSSCIQLISPFSQLVHWSSSNQNAWRCEASPSLGLRILIQSPFVSGSKPLMYSAHNLRYKLGCQ